MILRKDQLPGAPRGPRIMVRPNLPAEDSDFIITPDEFKHRPNKGIILAAGLLALDQMYDHDDRIGDDIWWGKFAGVVEEWDHIEDAAPNSDRCDHQWVGQKAPGPKSRKWECSKCESTRLAEHLLVMNVDDILVNVSHERRKENGEVSVYRGKTHDGRTRYAIERKDQ